MADAHQNLNGSRDLTTTLSGTIISHLWLAITTINLSTKFESQNIHVHSPHISVSDVSAQQLNGISRKYHCRIVKSNKI